MMDVINGTPKKHEQERVNLLGYITPILMDYAENNRIDPVVCYEVCHELELMVAEQCKTKGITTDELQRYRLAAEVNFKESNDSLIKDRMGRLGRRETRT
jgi:hypothetical protein